MEGVIMNFRGGRHTKSDNHMIVKVPGCDTRDQATKLLHKTVAWTTQTGKTITGTISTLHGNSGAVRVIFDKGMPGQAVGTKITINA